MLAKYILAILAVVFFLAAARGARPRGRAHPQVRTWTLIAALFSLVSAWLFVRG